MPSPRLSAADYALTVLPEFILAYERGVGETQTALASLRFLIEWRDAHPHVVLDETTEYALTQAREILLAEEMSS